MRQKLELRLKLAVRVRERSSGQLSERDSKTPDVCTNIITSTTTLKVDTLRLSVCIQDNKQVLINNKQELINNKQELINNKHNDIQLAACTCMYYLYVLGSNLVLRIYLTTAIHNYSKETMTMD